jgi:diguanylate cyclase (GGDEF)-like protein
MARRVDRQRAGMREQLEQMALHDPLTGLANRRLLADRLEEALRSCRRSDSVAVCFMDLDGFKTVNDLFGHEAGDELLRVLGDRLLETLGGSGTAARVGGDEFVVVRDRSGSTGSATELADRIRARIEEPCALNGRLVRVGVSVGVALGGVGDEAAATISRADAAMYLAKQRGGSCLELYGRGSHSPDLDRRAGTPERLGSATRAPSPVLVPLPKNDSRRRLARTRLT